MAIYHLSAQIIGKGAGRSAVAAAAYRHCAKMEREETAEEIDYSRKGGNAHSEFVVPDGAPAWIARVAQTHTAAEASAFFWNAVEQAEARKDAQLMREIVLALPNELTREQNIALVRDFVAQELSAHGIVADWAYHDMPNNPHVHVMTSLRALTDDGFGPKRVPVLGDDGAPLRGSDGKIRYSQFSGGPERLMEMREAWAQFQNHHLAKHGHDIRVDHRSFEEMGIDAVPTTHRGPAADNMDARGEASELAEKARTVARQNYELYADDPALVLKKITTQKAVFTRHDIAREIHKTECTPEEFQALFYRVGAHEELVSIAAPSFDPFTGDETSEALFSTRSMVELEHRMVQNIQAIATKQNWAAPANVVDRAFESFEAKRGFALTDQQKMVVRHLTSEAGAAALVGYAGAGKSTAIDATRSVLQQQGYTVVGGALAGIAADNLRSEAGVESRTLASWEYQWGRGNMLPDAKTVFIMDEAGMVSSDQMERITGRLAEAGAKMIVLGDARQLQPIQAGAAFRAFVDVTGYAELDTVVRQSEPWMREAAIAFGSGDAEAGVAAYVDQDKFAWNETSEEARTALIAEWMPHHRAGADVTVMAHRNKDVLALNADARNALQDAGALGTDTPFAAERGARSFAEGDRVLFLKNERSLDVFNGSTGTVRSADPNKLEVLVDGHLDPIVVRAHEYNHLDHGYARTIHKEQGNTVDRSFVYLSPTMDSQLSYVALTRHREDVTLYASREDFRSQGEMVEKMAQDRLQDSTALYRSTIDYKDAIQGFAERRGYPTTKTVVEFVRSNLAYLRERLERLAQRFDRLERPVDRSSPHLSRGSDAKAAVRSGRGQRPLPPHVPHTVHQAGRRLGRDLQAQATAGRAVRRFERRAHYELNVSDGARELRAFNKSVRAQFGEEAILQHGSHAPTSDSALLRDQSSEWQSFAQENWQTLFAAQWAEHKTNLQPLKAQDVRGQILPDAPTEKARPPMADPKILIDGVQDMPAVAPETLRVQAAQHSSMEPVIATAKDIAGRIYVQPDRAVEQLVDRFQKGQTADTVSEALYREPATLGDVKGVSRLGIANAEQREALKHIPALIQHTSRVGAAIDQTEGQIKTRHDQTRAAMAVPIRDLSPEAQRFVEDVKSVDKMPNGDAKLRAASELLKNAPAQKEVSQFQQSLNDRYGRGRTRIEAGSAVDPAIGRMKPAQKAAVMARLESVATALPAIQRLQTQVKQHERSRDVGKEGGRGIER